MPISPSCIQERPSRPTPRRTTPQSRDERFGRMPPKGAPRAPQRLWRMTPPHSSTYLHTRHNFGGRIGEARAQPRRIATNSNISLHPEKPRCCKKALLPDGFPRHGEVAETAGDGRFGALAVGAAGHVDQRREAAAPVAAFDAEADAFGLFQIGERRRIGVLDGAQPQRPACRSCRRASPAWRR